jgi:nitrogen fixation NifU-like protein
MYSAAVLDHFKNPRHAGELENATAVVEVTNPVCGDVLRLSVRVTDGRIADARFKAQGCVTAIACSSWLAEWMHGRTLDDLRGLTAESVSAALGVLPPATVHGSQLARDAVEAVLLQVG